MTKQSLESLIQRVEALERMIQTPIAVKDWRRAIGTIPDSEFSRQIDAEGQGIREAECAEARLVAEADSPADGPFAVDVPVPGQRSDQPACAPTRSHWRAQLVSDPSVMCGKLCAKGTRVPVTTLLDCLAEGASWDELLASYPSLRPEHIEAALKYAAELARGDCIRRQSDREL